MRVITVYGPTAEWGDGSGPLFYTDSLKEAGSYVRDERRLTVDYASQIDLDLAFSTDELQAFESAPVGSRAEYDAAAKLAGWPTNQVGYWLECVEYASLADACRYFGLDAVSDLEEFWEGVNSE